MKERLKENNYGSMMQLGVGCLAVAMFLASSFFVAPAQAPASPADAAKLPKFEVASIRLIPDNQVVPLTGSPISPPGAGQFTMREVTLALAIAWAFNADMDHISGGPGWVRSQCYEISAKPEGDVGLTYDQLRPLLQQLLQERFHLAYHRETKAMKGYALVVAKGGPKLKPSTSKADFGYIFTGRIRAQNRSVQTLVSMLGYQLHEPVVDKTGLKGNFDFDVSYAPTEGTDSDLPSIFTVVEEQLGLKLVSHSVPVETFVIDHVDRLPTEN
jgi:uncharacterized protein (TIGR03435 family)